MCAGGVACDRLHFTYPRFNRSIAMETFFNVLTHAVILSGLFGLAIFGCAAIRATGDFSEKLMMIGASMTGFLIYFGSRAMGLSIPQLVLPAISDPNPYKIGLVGAVIPACSGVLVAWHGLRCLRKSAGVSWRLLLLGGTFFTALLGDVYAATFAVEYARNGFDASLLPNLAFQIGMTLHLIFHFDANARAGGNYHDLRRDAHVAMKRFRSSSHASAAASPAGK
jgi:hypothetical protein